MHPLHLLEVSVEFVDASSSTGSLTLTSRSLCCSRLWPGHAVGAKHSDGPPFLPVDGPCPRMPNRHGANTVPGANNLGKRTHLAA